MLLQPKEREASIVFKAIPVSIVIASIVLPILFATKPNPKRSLRILQLTMIALALVWVLLCVYVYPRYVFAD
jgi:hypothetical protein